MVNYVILRVVTNPIVLTHTFTYKKSIVLTNTFTYKKSIFVGTLGEFW